MPQLNRCSHCDACRPLNPTTSLCYRCLAQALIPDAEKSESDRLKTIASLFPELELVEAAGTGSTGHVYRGRHIGLNRAVALKILDSGYAIDSEQAARFSQEAQVLARLHHPGIVTIFDAGLRQDCFYLVTEWVGENSLRQLVGSAPLQPVKTLRIVRQICAGLDYAHRQGVVHGDLKPENILMGEDDSVKLADFGLAQRQDPTAWIETDRLAGTPAYLAPELLEGSSVTPTVCSDLYSIGVVLYELLTGQLPVGRFPLPSELAPVGARLNRLVLKLLAKDPARRYRSAKRVEKNLISILRESASDRLSDTPDSSPQQRRRILAPASLACSTVWALLTVWHGWSPDNTADPAADLWRIVVFNAFLLLTLSICTLWVRSLFERLQDVGKQTLVVRRLLVGLAASVGGWILLLAAAQSMASESGLEAMLLAGSALAPALLCALPWWALRQHRLGGWQQPALFFSYVPLLAGYVTVIHSVELGFLLQASGAALSLGVSCRLLHAQATENSQIRLAGLHLGFLYLEGFLFSMLFSWDLHPDSRPVVVAALLLTLPVSALVASCFNRSCRWEGVNRALLAHRWIVGFLLIACLVSALPPPASSQLVETFFPEGFPAATREYFTVGPVQQVHHRLHTPPGEEGLPVDSQVPVGLHSPLSRRVGSNLKALLGWPLFRARCSATSPDGKLLAVCVERNIEIWDLQSWVVVGRLAGHRTEVDAVVFSQDGQILTSVGTHGEAWHRWDLSEL